MCEVFSRICHNRIDTLDNSKLQVEWECAFSNNIFEAEDMLINTIEKHKKFIVIIQKREFHPGSNIQRSSNNDACASCPRVL